MTSEQRLNSLFEVSTRLDGIDGVVCHHIEGGGAGAAWIHVDLPNGQVVYFANSGDTWGGELFASMNTIEDANPFDTRGVEFAYDSQDFDGIAAAFREVFMVNDVCMAGSPALNGKCGESDCVACGEPSPDHASDATAKFLDAQSKFVDAAQALWSEWSELQSTRHDYNGALGVDGYPFKPSFDELVCMMAQWHESTRAFVNAQALAAAGQS
jgi:hypothetical protein